MITEEIMAQVLDAPGMTPTAEKYLRWVAKKASTEEFWEGVKDYIRHAVSELEDDEDELPEGAFEEVEDEFSMEAWRLAYEAVYAHLREWASPPPVQSSDG